MLLALALSLPLLQADPAAAPVQAGRRALEAGRLEAARDHFLRALEERPDDPELLALMLELSSDHPDAARVWAYRWHAAAADARGRVKVPADLKKRLPSKGSDFARLAQLRATAVADLAAMSTKAVTRGDKVPQDLVTAEWARQLARRLAAGSPAVRSAEVDSLPTRFETSARFHDPVLKALHRAMRTAAAGPERGTALELARSLRALGVQADFEDLQGPRPRGMDRYRSDAEETLRRLRENLVRGSEDPWTVEELEWLVREEGEAFTREHDSFGRPGVAVSPGELYRIETDCGHQTLLGVASTVELHHQRLVQWFGQDPFTGRQGLVRIVPEAGGLEAEGTPFWWAGGFQAGDLTVLRFSCGTIEGLGHGLTHELTHRFDGAVYPGIPAWLAEGRAVWTGAAYGRSEDTDFVSNHASFGTIENAFVKGYGGEQKLTELIDGSLEDYRDNYVAGYALFVYLNTWEEHGRTLFADRLVQYMRSAAKDDRDPLVRFSDYFADGREGRPADFAAFAQGFGTFVRGFYWKEPAPFADRYERRIESGGRRREYVYDEPTWTWERRRAEPVFGQGHAFQVGELLLGQGLERDAFRAWLWAWSADEPRPSRLGRLGTLAADLGHEEAAWVLAWMRGVTEEAAPGGLAPRSVVELEAQLTESAEQAAEDGLSTYAAALRADASLLRSALGLDPQAPAEAAPDLTLAGLDPPAGRVGRPGWVEDGLVGFEERRVEGLWYVDDGGDLHVGREQPRTGTGRLDRRAHQRHAFVRSLDWFDPGSYVLRARVRFTTSYASGAVLFGFSRRDQGLSFSFDAGDFMYAIGESEEEPKFEKMGWGLSGAYEREGHLSGSRPGGAFTFERPAPAFDLELLIDGPTVRASVDGEFVGTYTDPHGQPIAGHLGFATRMGAIRVERPTFERLEGARSQQSSPRARLDVDLAGSTWPAFDDLENRRLAGLAPATNGTLAGWVPVYPDDEPGSLDIDRIERKLWETHRDLVRILEVDASPQATTLIVPQGVGAEILDRWRQELAAESGPSVALHTHRVVSTEADEGKRWLLFLDPAGIVRHASTRLRADQTGPESRIAHWLAVFRDRGRPARDLPGYSRGPGAEEGESEGE